MDLTSTIHLCDDVAISPGVSILTHAALGDRPLKSVYPTKIGGVVIEEGAWIGGGAIILAGVHIGRCAVVGAGSVVTRFVPPGVVVAGSPAKQIDVVDMDKVSSWEKTREKERCCQR